MSWLARARHRLVDLAIFIYPPYGLHRLGPTSDSSEDESDRLPLFGSKRWADAEVQKSHLAAAEMIHRAELDRKKTIEDKAANFLVGATLSSGILIALPTLLAEKTSAPMWAKIFMLAMFMVAVAYLVNSAMYAIRVRAAGQYYAINSSSLAGLALSSGDFRRNWATLLLDLTKRNQGFLLKKTNELYVAEQLFLRGLQAAPLAGLILAILAVAYPPERQQRADHLQPLYDSRDALYIELSKCNGEYSALSHQIAAQDSTLLELRAKADAELKAKLDSRLKSSQQVKLKASANAKSANTQSSTHVESPGLQQGCPPPGAGISTTLSPHEP